MKFLNLLFVLAIMFSFAACEPAKPTTEGEATDSTKTETTTTPEVKEEVKSDSAKAGEEKKEEKKEEKTGK